MSQSPNRFTQFWQELKRRKVIKVIAMYAATAFIIMEAADIMLPRLGLPDWTVTFLIILLIVGFPITLILSWIFDVTPEGIKKTGSIEEVSEQEPTSAPLKRRLKGSDVIITVLFVAVCILLYPKIFKADKFENIRDEDGRVSIAVLPFQNMTNDTLWDIWQVGIQNELITSLSNSNELSVRQYQTMQEILQKTEQTNYASLTSSVAGEISRKLEANTFIQGSIKSAGEKFRLNVHLIDARTEEIYKTFQIGGETVEDIFSVTDSLGRLLRNYLEIKVLERDENYDVNVWAPKSSAEAYKYYIQGMNFFIAAKFPSAIELFSDAIKVDSNLIGAYIYLTFALKNSGNFEEARLSFQKAYERIESATYTEQIALKGLKSFFDKDQAAVIKYTELLLEDDPQARMVWYQQGLNYLQMKQYEEAISHFERALEIDKQWHGEWKWPAVYRLAGLVYHELGNHNREREIYERGLSVLPDHPGIIFRQAICALSQGDTKAENYIEKYKLIRKAEGLTDYWINYFIGRIYEDAKQYSEAIGIFRELIALEPQEPWSKFQLGFIIIANEIDVEEGMTLINLALKSQPENWIFLYTKGLGYFKQGMIKESYEILKAAWNLRQQYHHDHYLLLQKVEQTIASQNN